MLHSTIDYIPSVVQTQLPLKNRRTELEVTLEFVDNLVFERTGKYLSTLQRAVFRASWSGHNQSYHEIAEAYGYSTNYLKQDVGPKLWKLLSEILGEKVSKSNFQAVLERQNSVRDAAVLAAGCVRQIQQEFEFIIWRSLRYAPSLREFLASTVSFLSDEQTSDSPADISSQILQLVNYLHAHRCLIVLDGVEAIFKNGDRSGEYLEGYEGYGELLEKIGTTTHQSAIVLTKRSQNSEVGSWIF